MFSTYQTMIKLVDTDERPFSIGRFDLIIVDEAHRSIFGKYGAIFSYFDAMLIGLTATPREEVERSTYDIFELEQGSPNYAYELEQAVSDGYLVNYVPLKRGSLILENGIRYNDLTPEEQERMEVIWEYEATRQALAGGEPRDIGSNELFTYIHNVHTIDLVLQDLMENGLKVQNGERIGKTIIFAAGHHHAQLIVERFNTLYPEYGPDFCVLIDNQVNYAQSLIDKFEVRDNEPQIAVSVDMLDTGIDVPDVLNLVLFKRVKSKIKFMQMLGRGTRLSPDVFGIGEDKKEFYVFDWCNNFEYFSKNPNGQTLDRVMSLTEKLFGLRTDIAFHLQHQIYQEDEFAKSLHDDLKLILREQVQKLNENHISVREKWEAVSHYKEESSWLALSHLDTWTLKNTIAPLIVKNTNDVDAKRFDVLMLQIELSLLDEEVYADRAVLNVQKVAEALESKAVLPQVKAKMTTIHEVLNPTYWEMCTANKDFSWLEKVRIELRELTKFLTGDKNKWFVVNIQDEASFGTVSGEISTRVSYRQNILDFLAKHRDLPVLDKIYTMQQLTTSDIRELERILWSELGSKEDYDRCTESMLCGSNVAMFIRSLIGVDRKVAVARFSDFLSGAKLNSDQEEYLATIINYVCVNGDITVETVVNDDPFADYLHSIFGEYQVPLAQYINNIHGVIIPITA
jgi:type I restriction enzyme R subunit